MHIYKIIPDLDNYDSLMLPKAEDYDVFDNFDGTALKDSWKPINVLVNHSEKRGDFFYLTVGLPVVSRKALDVFLPLIKHNVEVLPLIAESKSLYAINILDLLDCIDYQRSEVSRFEDGDVMEIEKYVFRKNVLKNKHIFKIKEFPLGYVYVSDTFKNIVESNKLAGLIFEEVK